jgi:hypothetical protein
MKIEEESSVMEMDEMHGRLAKGQGQIDLREFGEEIRSKSGKEVSNFIRKYYIYYENFTAFSSIRILLSSDCVRLEFLKNTGNLLSFANKDQLFLVGKSR